MVLTMMIQLLIFSLYIVPHGLPDGGVDISFHHDGIYHVIQCKDHEHTLGNYFIL